ncbi:tetratricopeptide repeat protein [Oceanimonas doudoroffii]|uniref:protein O-GlcNAc transferase n=1 Tax=Oceanimonas doudoroffii TaxID=84158 RepID=A0A233RIQ2_9GAMM|nr:tetratricopeptide repeat protein [Oceanimonas doudoroffii]OXY83264.1 hypothetical protein B6S08_07165 [Oceanimonas doudoroffii]
MTQSKNDKEQTTQFAEQTRPTLEKALQLLRSSQSKQALDLLQQALTNTPDQISTLLLKGKIHRERGETEHAVRDFQHILSLAPAHHEANLELAKLYHNANENRVALHHIELAEKNQPKHQQTLEYKSMILGGLHRYNEAAAILEHIIEHGKPHHFNWNNLANIYKGLGMFEKAERYYLTAIELSGDNDIAYNNYLSFCHYIPHYPKEKILTLYKEWEERYAKNISKMPLPATALNPDKTLRIGMISDGFRTHPVGQMITSALEEIPAHEIEIYAYSTNLSEDTVTQRIKNLSAKWMTVVHLGEQDLAHQLIEDNIDILFDLCGHNSGSHMRTMAMKPAPILVKWVGGLINTTGLSTMDYLLSDQIETPEGEDEFYTEKLIRLPDDYICYNSPIYTPDIHAPPAKYNGYITLGCFNNPTKLNPYLLEKWAGIMHALPHSRLLLKGFQFSSDTLRNNVRAQFGRLNIEADRILFEGPSPHAELLQTYNKVDIALDPWPYSGGLTTCEAMYMGVPVVTLPGPTFAGRHSATHLTNVGLGQLVAENWQQYHDIVVSLAGDLDNLSSIRAHLRAALLESPLCDAPRFARHFSNAMRAIWQRHCEHKAPAALTLDTNGHARFEGEAEPVQLQLPADPLVIEEDEFRFRFNGKIVVLDNGGILASSHRFSMFHKLNVFSTLCLDPGSRIANAQQLQQTGDFQHVPMTTLGDGEQVILSITQDPAYSGTLPPLEFDQQPEQTAQIYQQIAQVPINTVRLDDIAGIETLEWLVLDNLNDFDPILANGVATLAHPLLVQIRVNFLPTHRKQIALADCQQRMAELGFDFHSLFNQRKIDACTNYDEQLLFADAVFIPNADRCADLGANQRLKLAFLLHAVYQSHACAHQLLAELDPDMAEDYRNSLSEVERKQLETPLLATGDKSATEDLDATQRSTSPQRETMQSAEGSFSFNFTGHIIALEHGAILTCKPYFEDFLKQGGVNYICLDPGGLIRDAQPLQHTGLFQHFPLTVLGDGSEMELALAVQAERSTTLPIYQADPVSIIPGQASPELVSTMLVTSNRIDDIEGIEHIDWLILDEQHHNLSILEHGKQKLANALLIEVGISFSPEHSTQVNFENIRKKLNQLGFRLLKINDIKHNNFHPNPELNQEESELASGTLIFIPDNKKLDTYSNDQVNKLAFLLDSIHNMQGVTFKLLHSLNPEQAKLYLQSKSLEKNTFPIPTCPAMTDSEKKLFIKHLKEANHYFEFGSGGSTVWAVEQGLAVEGVESDPNWVSALQNTLGQQCQVKVVDIGPTGDWGYPLTEQKDKFPLYSQAILSHNKAFDFILIDGRFRVACVMTTIEHIIKHENQNSSLIFIHDFWNRPQYHCVLEHLEVVDKIDTAGVFRVKDDIELRLIHNIWSEYSINPA